MSPSAVTMKQNTDKLFTILSNIAIKYADVEDLAIDVLLVTIEIDQVNYDGEAENASVPVDSPHVKTDKAEIAEEEKREEN